MKSPLVLGNGLILSQFIEYFVLNGRDLFAATGTIVDKDGFLQPVSATFTQLGQNLRIQSIGFHLDLVRIDQFPLRRTDFLDDLLGQGEALFEEIFPELRAIRFHHDHIILGSGHQQKHVKILLIDVVTARVDVEAAVQSADFYGGHRCVEGNGGRHQCG